jgi:Bifunctional DNA primase/polymerase, N-terminal/Primase C terminal 1 (PriCT-1)
VSGVFAEWQPRYAEHGVATFPVENKRPCVRHWQKVGLKGSSQLAMKFADADAFGFQCGPRSRITLIDIDSPDERVVGEAIKLYGESPIIWRTGSGNHAMPFRHNGEPRRIRPMSELPIDMLGGGFAVAPPSMGAKRRYKFLQGDLADLDHLPVARVAEIEQPEAEEDLRDRICEGKRDDALFRHALTQAPHVDSFDALVDVVHTRNMDCEPPLPDAEVSRIATSAWRYQQEGRNLVGLGRAFVVSNADYKLVREEGGDAAALLYCDLRSQHWGRDFVLSKAMAATMRWGVPKWKRARDALLRLGFIHCIHAGGNGPHDPPIYTWAKGCRSIPQ